MAPSPWATPEQQEFLIQEDSKWEIIKSGGGTLKHFYVRTAVTFLKKWPVDPTPGMLKAAGDDSEKAQQLAEERLQTRIANWYTHRHRQKKTLPAVSKPILDLAGKGSRKKPPLQKWQAFSSVYYRPKDSPLRAEVKSLYSQRSDPTAVQYLSEFLPNDLDIAATDPLTFLGVWARKRCTHLTSEDTGGRSTWNW
ncbi:hypothetical protein BJ322DRAFT_1108724 [Thelephora terrestris]|uniref:Uncharacterized protein n=1 Tax=Thelephora terrestris TaxID=56493 RepID=A0A9P6HEC7_9AGAM|nr:hypothetical protein BJ322DRAFT_1108724 [Thelephora terrestris]